MGGAAAAVVTRKKIRKIVKQEIENERKSHTGPGFNGISFFLDATAAGCSSWSLGKKHPELAETQMWRTVGSLGLAVTCPSQPPKQFPASHGILSWPPPSGWSRA